MAHFIQAIIGRNKQLEKFALKWENALLIPLEQDICLIPWSYELRKEIDTKVVGSNTSLNNSFEWASPSLFQILETESVNGQIGYIETNYFGGDGTQASILFMNRETIGPFQTEKFKAAEENAINKVLSILGVDKQNFHDEFAALGLMDIRDNQSMAKYGI